MESESKPNILKKFLESKKAYAVLTAVAAGLYPLFFYYANNLILVNSKRHLAYFIGLFLILPIVTFFGIDRLFRKEKFDGIRKYALPFLNAFAFLFLIQLCLYAQLQLIFSIAAFVIALLFSWFLHRHLKKVVILQLILAVMGLISLVPVLYKQFNYSSEWLNQPDDISEVIFKKRPNVYYIEPDGYLNFSEFGKGFYDRNSNGFKEYLESKNFTTYDGVRSNYNATMISNTATFGMKHHYLANRFNLSEVINGREIVISKNPVLDIFKSNNYKTHFLAEWPLFLWNLPKMGYDACNYNEDDIKFVGDGYYREKEINNSLQEFIKEDPDKSKFFFIQVFSPGHVKYYEHESKGKIAERDAWYERLDVANTKLKTLIDIITNNDPGALIVIMADHGGYVGFDFMEEIHTKTLDRNKLYSAFSVNFAIRWPDGIPYENDSKFKSSVNTFRILFSYLGENPRYLDHLEEDASFLVIEKGAPKGVYECINGTGEVIFKEYTGYYE
jgi:hypothetical protein